MKKIVLIVLGIFFVAFISFKLGNDTSAHEVLIDYSRMQDNMKIIIVPYFDPRDMQWDTIYALADKYPGIIQYAIINPCSGPCGGVISNDWKNVIMNLQNHGIKTLGYIFNTSESLENINYYMKSSVPTDGIFFDNESSIDNLENFKQFSGYVHSLGGIVYVNPGYSFPHVGKYLTTGNADIANIYEIDSEKSHHILMNSKLPPQRLSVILGNVSSSDEMISKINEVASKGIGIAYVYSDSYHALPMFFTEEIRQASMTKIKH